jgi:hypothetical protein
MRLLTVLSVSLVLTASISAQPFVVSDFECQTGGQVMSATPDCEGWVSVDLLGKAQVLPDGINVVTGCPGVMPTTGSQWCEVTSSLIGPASPTVPPSTPGTWPFVQGTVAEMQLTTSVPNYPSGTAAVSVDWYWATQETANGSAGTGAPCPCDDFSQIVIVNQATMTVMATLLYVDTYGALQGGNPCPSSVSGGLVSANYAGPTATATVVLPPGSAGTTVIISVVTANQGDGSFESTLFIDNLRMVDAASVFSLTATTSGGGAGDVMLGISGLPASASNILLLISGTPAPGGLGSGPAFGLVPDALFFATLFLPSAPLNPFHFPIGANPFAGGTLSFPSGTVTGFNGQTWEVTAIGYSPAMGLVGQTNFQSLTW